MLNKLRKYRQELHQIPELANEEYKTKAYILGLLEQYDCEITELCGTAVCAFFKGMNDLDNPGTARKTIAFRSDMDALPIQEATEAPYCSCHSGMMHACGHDGHMAMLLGLAAKLQENMSSLIHNVLLIFQPAEESIGGAQCICQSGILSKYQVSEIYGIHLWPALEKHSVASRPKELMAQSNEINVHVLGKGAHCADPENGIDALSIACRLLSDYYTMVDQEISKKEFPLLRFGKMTSGTVRNVIAESATLQGTMRCFNRETLNFMIKRMGEIASSYEARYGCKIKISYSQGYPPVINDHDLFVRAKSQLKDFNFITIDRPSMLSEDFSFYQQQVPGLYFFLGTGSDVPLHSSLFDFDESVLETGLKVYLKLLNLA